MARNYELEVSGVMFWEETTRSVNFKGKQYDIDFLELKPEQYSSNSVEEVDDHTAILKVRDPNNLI
jgi:hypothetical protein